MLTICWAAKGGSGTSVTAAAMALASVEPTLVIDLAGQLPAILGVPEPDTPGIFDWFDSDASIQRLAALETPLTPNAALIHRGTPHRMPADRWGLAAAHWVGAGPRVIVDAGTRPPECVTNVAGATSLLVTRPCYLAVRAAARSIAQPTEIVMIDEPGRSLRTADIEHALGAPVVATLMCDPAVARAVDAGLLISRIPTAMRRQLRRVAA